jgi:hypothetical protein
MTFKILNDEARGQIAAHIFGAAPPGHPRAGSVSGTDAPAKSYEPPPPRYGGTHTYQSGGSGPTGSQGEGGRQGGNVCVADPRTGFAQPVPPNHDHQCPPDTGTITWRKVFSPGDFGMMCCPNFNEAAAQGGPGGSPGGVRPPTALPEVARCPSGMQQGSPLGAVTRESTRFAQYTAECSNNGGTLTEAHVRGFFVCCRPETPSEPPSGTGTGTGSVEEDGGFPETWGGICSLATLTTDIASKSYGWATIMTSDPAGYPETGDINCTHINDGQFTGQTFSSDTSCENIVSFSGAVYAYNPGGSTIARNTQVVVVRMQDPSEISLVTRAIIVVVPCT